MIFSENRFTLFGIMLWRHLNEPGALTAILEQGTATGGAPRFTRAPSEVAHQERKIFTPHSEAGC
jgi:cation diffusion facilitator CzcD-associated flavoprotein CzcO